MPTRAASDPPPSWAGGTSGVIVGVGVSDDPFPAARSAVYAVSFDRRAAEASYYPETAK